MAIYGSHRGSLFSQESSMAELRICESNSIPVETNWKSVQPVTGTPSIYWVFIGSHMAGASYLTGFTLCPTEYFDIPVIDG